MAVGIKDVARAANVSEATVSLALNGSPLVNEQTRQRIIKIAQSMNYTPNPYARQLVLKRSGVIGLVVPSIENYYYATFVKHVNRAIRSTGYGLTISISENDPENEAKIIQEMINNRVEALLLAPVNIPNDQPDYLSLLIDSEIPTIFVTSRYLVDGFSCVMCDLFGGMKTLIYYLNNRGYNNTLLLTGPQGSYALDQRTEAALTAAKQLNLTRLDVVNLPDVTYEAVYESMEYIKTDEYDALVCVNDMMALAAYNSLTMRGLKVPQDIAIAGFDDVIFSQISPIPLTTVAQDIEGMAKTATESALSLLQAKTATTLESILPCKLVIRKST
ncbi:MAG: LacI family DNA-binding transcriptional regulator [Caldicoprobacterales bacterium]|jgi:LacI family transcriptional regulator